MKIDFIHIGYHKTGSSWLQIYGFPSHPEIVLCNDARTSLDTFFVKNFVEVPDFFFDAEKFDKTFFSMVKDQKGWNKSKVYGISEENISGHFWNGVGAEIIATRIKKVFGDTKIIIFIRNQYDMLLSLYSNYIISGGTNSLRRLFSDINMFGELVFYKLCYHRLVEYYLNLFSVENVLVLCHEELLEDPNATLNKIFAFIGVKPIILQDKIKNKKINIRLSIISEIIVRYLNFFGVRVIGELLRIPDRFLSHHFRRNNLYLKDIISEEYITQWKKSNSIMQKYVISDLCLYHYPL